MKGGMTGSRKRSVLVSIIRTGELDVGCDNKEVLDR